MEDFYSECDQHLNVVRQCLTHLEQQATGSEVKPSVEKLFRSFHSLKGIIAMVGIVSAEQIAHRTEDFLRDVSHERAVLDAHGTDLIARAAHLIEQTVAAFRDKRPLPDGAELLGGLNQVIPKTEPVPEEKKEQPAVAKEDLGQTKISEALAKGLQVWRYLFTPSPALNEKGINVNRIRERLSAQGEIIHAAPRIGGGAIAFEFLLATQESPAESFDREKDGVSFERILAPTTAPASAAGTPAPISQFVAPSQMVRVGLNRLDDLMRVAGELVIQRARLEEQINRLAAKPGVDVRGLQEVNTGFGRHFRELRETVMRLRMVPVAEVFDRLPFVVRDLARNTGKKVQVELRGQQTQLDKFVVEQLKDPLLHLVRNAISHGIEDSEQRVAAGKPAEATLTLTAKTAGETVLIEIADDGRGIDRDKVLERAEKLGLTLPDDATDAALLDLICLPGFSTRDEADRASGRGVGMAVVNNTLRELGGAISLNSEPGKGTRFVLRLPLTLLITEALIISSGDQQFAIPQSSIEEVLHIEETKVKRMERTELVSVRGKALPIIRLRAVFGYPKSDKAMPSVLVSQTDRGRVGLVVDRILGQRAVVVRSLRDPLIHVPGVIGATELGDGRPLLILDPFVLTKPSETETALARR